VVRKLAVSVLAMLGSSALAQSPKTPPPTAPKGVTTDMKVPRVTVDVSQLRDESRTDIVRLVQPLNDPATWVTAADYPVLWKSDKIGAWVMANLKVDAAGAITACTGEAHANRIKAGDIWVDDTRVDWLALSCGLLKQRAKLRPSLAADRATHPGTIRIYIHYELIQPDSKFPGGLSNAPPPPPRLDEWPPRYPSRDVLVEKFAKFGKGVPAKVRATWVGEAGAWLIISDAGAVTECKILKASGNSAIDDATCAGLSKSKYRVPRPMPYNKGRNSFYVLTLWDKGLAIPMPGTVQPTRAKLLPATEGTLSAWGNAAYPADALAAKASGITEMELAFDKKGQVTQCYALVSAGHDSLDLAACALTYRLQGGVTTGTDVFGQAIAGRIGGVRLTWTLPKP
jgi:hypothetical protein